MGKTILVSPRKVDTDSTVAIALWLMLTTTVPVLARPTLSSLLEQRENQIEFDMVDVNYRFGSEPDNVEHPAWFDEETKAVVLFDIGKQGHGKVKVYDHHFAVPGNSFKKAKSATRLVWEEYKDCVKDNPIVYELLEELVSWVDELDSRSVDRNQEIKEILYTMMAPIAMQEAGYKRVKIHTNHISGISFLPKLIAKQARGLESVRDQNTRIRILQQVLEKTLIAIGDYLYRGKGYLSNLHEDWNSLSGKITTTELNPLLDLIVVKNSPLPISILRYRLNQRYQKEALKKYYLLISTFSQSQNLRIHKNFPQSLIDLDLDALKNHFMNRYNILESYTYKEEHALSLNDIREHLYILDDAIYYCQNHLKMKVPAEHIVQLFKVMNDLTGFIGENVSNPEQTTVLFAEIEDVLNKNENAVIIGKKSAAVKV